MKKLPVGRQNFKEIITENLLYVDKTKQIFDLIDVGKLYFLARPRRFGKSLTISVLGEIFSENRELFEGLYIAEESNYDWTEYPVVRFSFGSLGIGIDDLESALIEELYRQAEEFEVNIESVSLVGRFKKLIRGIAQKRKPVAILIDEYDKLGITQQELLECFPEYITKISQKYHTSETEILEEIKLWYNGYSFEGVTRLYNPFSLLRNDEKITPPTRQVFLSSFSF